MSFNTKCYNDFDGTDVRGEGGLGDNNNVYVMNNDRDVPNIWSATNIRYG